MLSAHPVNTDAITCPSCNAADRSTADAHGVHVCEYCGIRYRLRHGEPHALAPAAAASPWRSPQVLVVVALAVGLGVAIGRSSSDSSAPPTSPPSEPTAPPPDPASAPGPTLPPSSDSPARPSYTPPPAPPDDAARAEFTLDGTRPGYRGALYVLGRVTNASAFPIRSAAVTVVLLDEADREVHVDKSYTSAPVIEPGASTPISIMLSDPPAHARMAFEAEARPADPTAVLPAVRLVDPVAEPPREGTRWSFRGRIANDGDVPLRFTRVVVFGISADGKTLGEQTTYANIEILPPGQAARWVMQCDDFTATPARFEYIPLGDFVN